MIPEIHNIIARWNKEAGVKNTAIKIKELHGDFCQDKEIIIDILSDHPGWLIGKQGSIITKHESDIKEFYKKWHPKAKVTLNLVEISEIVGQEEIDTDEYYQGLI